MSNAKPWLTVVRAVVMVRALCVLPAFAQTDATTIDGKPLSELLKQLRSDNRGLQMRAAQALSAAPTNLQAPIIPLVIPVLKSERENDKFVAAQVLGVYGPISRVAIPDLLPMLKGTQFERNRAAASKALGQILKDAKPDHEVDGVTAALIEAFKDSYEDVRREAVTKYREDHTDCSLINKEAVKTLGILKGMADGNAEKAAPGGK